MDAASTGTPHIHQSVAVNGIQLYYEVHSAGTPLLLLHGFSGTGRTLEHFIADYAPYYQVIIPDLRGHGRSTNPAKHFTHRQAALDLFALLDQLQLDRIRAIGLSTGASVLLHMATQQPSRVEAMVLNGAEPYYSPQARVIYRELNADSEGWDWTQLRHQHVHGDEQIRALLDQFQEFATNVDDMHFTPPILATITAATLIVQGDRDAYIPVSAAVEMYTSIPHAYLWVVPNGEHIPIMGQHRAAFIQMSLELFHGEWPGFS